MAEQEKELYTHKVPLGGKRTHIGGGWLPSREELAQFEKLSPAEFEILSSRMNSIGELGRQTTMRVSGSPVAAEGGEVLFGINDPHGFSSSIVTGLPLQGLGGENCIREILELQGEVHGIYDGDIFMYNEPLVVGYHACDQWNGTPIFHKGELVAWLGSLTHTAEPGAIEPGGLVSAARSLLHEGYRVQGIKVQEKGKISQAVLNCLLRSTRDPGYYVLDLRARIAALNVGKERFLQLIERYGIDKVKAALQQNIDHAEEIMRAKLRSLADGTWRATHYTDWDVGPEPKLIKIALTMVKEGDTLILDFEATPPNAGWRNCYPPGAFGLVYAVLSTILCWQVPGNHGFLRPIKAYFPKNTCLNAPYLTPCCLCAGLMLEDPVTATISKMLYTNEKYWPDINAYSTSGRSGTIWGGLTQHGYPSGGMFTELWGGGTGAGIDVGRGDGCDGGGTMEMGAPCISDVEVQELITPFLYLWRRDGIDSAGAGRWRGGASVESAITPHNSPFVLQATVVNDGYVDHSSMFGAYPPTFGGVHEVFKGLKLTEAFKRKRIPQSSEELHKLMDELGGQAEIRRHDTTMEPIQTDSDVVVSPSAGGEGIGDPLDREPERIVEDVCARIYSVDFAREVFGVVIDPKALAVDLEATEVQREKIKANRRKRAKIWGKK